MEVAIMYYNMFFIGDILVEYLIMYLKQGKKIR